MIAGVVQANGGKWMKMEEKKVVTDESAGGRGGEMAVRNSVYASYGIV